MVDKARENIWADSGRVTSNFREDVTSPSRFCLLWDTAHGCETETGISTKGLQEYEVVEYSMRLHNGFTVILSE